VVLEEWRQHRDATGRMQEAYWSLLTSGSRVSQANMPDRSVLVNFSCHNERPVSILYRTLCQVGRSIHLLTVF
jgi:hypothetical protein